MLSLIEQSYIVIFYKFVSCDVCAVSQVLTLRVRGVFMRWHPVCMSTSAILTLGMCGVCMVCVHYGGFLHRCGVGMRGHSVCVVFFVLSFCRCGVICVDTPHV